MAFFSPIVMIYVLSAVLSFTTFCGSSRPKSDVSASESNFFEAVMLVAFPSSDVTLLVLILREVSLSQTHWSSSSVLRLKVNSYNVKTN